MSQIVFIAVLLLYGGFYDWNVTIGGFLIMAAVLRHYLQKKPVYRGGTGIAGMLPWLLPAVPLAVSFWAVDWADNLSGVLRGIVLMLWLYLCVQVREEGRDRILWSLPVLGAAITAVGIISLAVPGLKSLFWRAGRFGGVFQYANTCALFLFFGIVLQVERMKREEKSAFIQKVLLLTLSVGLLLTGSRGVLLLFFIWGIYRSCKSRRFCIFFLSGTVIALGTAWLYALISGSYQNVGRIFTLLTANSTIYGRLLYLSDGLCMVIRHPFGLGYMGYYYIQGAEQTGVYTLRFVHNDFIQLALDYGIVALLLFVFCLGWQFFRGKQDGVKKELLALLCAASLMDFHLQYLSFLMIGTLLLHFDEEQNRKKRNDLREDYFFLTVGMGVMLYFTISFGAAYFGSPETALSFFPVYTEAQLAQLDKETDRRRAEELADAILEHNACAVQAYNCKAYAAAMEGDYQAACKYKDRVIELRKYDVEAYRLYDELLDDMIAQWGGEHEAAVYLMAKKEELPKRLKALRETTSPLAFQIRDMPEFEW